MDLHGVAAPPKKTHQVHGAERRNKMREYFIYGDIVKVTDPSTGEGVIGEIGFVIKSKRLGTGDDPDWVCIKGTWYRDNEVQLATTQDIRDYQGSVVQNRPPAGTRFQCGRHCQSHLLLIKQKLVCCTMFPNDLHCLIASPNTSLQQQTRVVFSKAYV